MPWLEVRYSHIRSLSSMVDPGSERWSRSLCDCTTEADMHRGVAEYEFYQFRAPKSHSNGVDDHNSSATARFIKDRSPNDLPHLTEGMFGYSLTDPVRNQEWFYHIWDACEQFRCGIEGWHTESGPGVFEAVGFVHLHSARALTEIVGTQLLRSTRDGRQGCTFQVHSSIDATSP